MHHIVYLACVHYKQRNIDIRNGIAAFVYQIDQYNQDKTCPFL